MGSWRSGMGRRRREDLLLAEGKGKVEQRVSHGGKAWSSRGVRWAGKEKRMGRCRRGNSKWRRETGMWS